MPAHGIGTESSSLGAPLLERTSSQAQLAAATLRTVEEHDRVTTATPSMARYSLENEANVPREVLAKASEFALFRAQLHDHTADQAWDQRDEQIAEGKRLRDDSDFRLGTLDEVRSRAYFHAAEENLFLGAHHRITAKVLRGARPALEKRPGMNPQHTVFDLERRTFGMVECMIGRLIGDESAYKWVQNQAPPPWIKSATRPNARLPLQTAEIERRLEEIR